MAICSWKLYSKYRGSPVKQIRIENGKKTAALEREHKQVVQCDKKTHEKIRIFNSIKEASEITGVCLTSIYKVINGTRNTAGGYYWIEYIEN